MEAGKSSARRAYEEKLVLAVKEDVADLCNCDSHDARFERRLRSLLPRLLESLERQGAVFPVS